MRIKWLNTGMNEGHFSAAANWLSLMAISHLSTRTIVALAEEVIGESGLLEGKQMISSARQRAG